MNYKDKRWLRKREYILKRDGYNCQESKRYGKRVTATMVHHIYPADLYPELRYVDWNLISFSDNKHNGMHDRVTGEITELGKEWQERVKDKFDSWIQSRKIQSPPVE